MKNSKILLTILSMGFVLASCGERSSSSVDSKVSTLGSEALVFDYSGVTDADSLAALTGETAKVAVYNDEIPYGSDILPYRYMTIAAIYDSKTKKQTINIETILGTTVYFSVAMPKKNDPEHYTYYSIKSEKKTSDYTQTKYSVVFNKADLSVTIPVGNAN